MRGPSRKVRDSNWRAMHGEAAASSEVSTATKTATTTEVAATAAKTATLEAAATEVAATATKTATMASATTAKSTSATTATTAMPSRRRGLTEGKQTEANDAKYCFCFHILSSL